MKLRNSQVLLGALPLCAAFFGSLFAGTETLYLGCCGKDPAGNGLFVAEFDDAAGRLGPMKRAAEAASPSFMAITPDGKNLFAILYAPKDEKVAGFEIQPDHLLKLINSQPTGQTSACHVAVNPSKRALLTANYDPASLQSFPLDVENALGACTSTIPLVGSGPNLNRQRSAHGHAMYFDPAGKFIYGCDLGSDKIWIFKADALPALVPNDPPFAATEPGGGPRHLAFSKEGKCVYVVNEMAVSVTTFEQDAKTGNLIKKETISCLPPNRATTSITSAEIFVHPSGRWLYVSCRDTAGRGLDTLAVFALGSEGRLTLAQSCPAVVHSPRSFALDPTGRWLIAGGEKDNQLAVFKIDPEKGTLTLSSQLSGVSDPQCVMFKP